MKTHKTHKKYTTYTPHTPHTLITAIALTLAVSVTVTAAVPAPVGDESLYVNLDYYGTAENASIVKSYSMNGMRTITDYGTYSEVINMSNYTNPQKNDDKTTFTFAEDVDRFYFEGKLKNPNVQLPWTFDLTYKLNGVVTTAENLAGEKGLVELQIHALPNPNAPEYFKNNMVLQVGTAVDADKILSVEAPGAQVQTLGNRKAIVFVALPQEEQTFVIRIGSDNFEFSGIAMMMMPITLSQLEDISNLREAKSKIENSADAMNNSMDVILDTLNGLQKGFGETIDGLNALDTARNTINTNKDAVYENADVAAEDMKAMAADISPMLEDLDNTKTTLTLAVSQLNDMQTTVKGFKPQITQLQDEIKSLQKDIDGMKNIFDDAKDDDGVKYNVKYYRERLRKSMNLISADLGDVNTLMKTLNSPMGLALLSERIDNLPNITPKDAGALKQLISGMVNELSSITNSGVGLNESVTPLLDELDDFLDDFDLHKDDITSLMTHLNEMGDLAITASNQCAALIDNTTALVDTATQQEPKIQKSLTDMQAVISTGITSIDDTYALVKKMESVAKESGTQLNDGTQKTFQGLISSLQQSMGGLSQTMVLKNAKDSVKNLIDDEWTKYTEENNGLLNIDTSQSAMSFTSDKNPTPQSVQVILRTKEITKNDAVAIAANVEETSNGTVVSRIADVFKKLWSIVVGIFGM